MDNIVDNEERKRKVEVEVTSLKPGDRVEVHPATNAWIFGDTHGGVVKLGTKWVHVKMDRSGKVRKFRYFDIYRRIV